MKVAYVIGPFRAKNSWDMEQNIRRAEEVALQLWKAGFAVICPHANTRFFQGAAPDSVWLDGDIEILRRCDCAVAVDGWEHSEGSKHEIGFMSREGKPVFFDVQEAINWINEA